MKQAFIDIISKADKKVLVPRFDSQYRFELLRFEKFYSIYFHSKGSKWNLGGNHYHYLHGLDGNSQGTCNSIQGRPIEKMRLLKSDILELQKFIKIPENNS